MTLKTRYFQTANDVTKFCNDGANAVTTIISITFDTASGKFVLFYE